MKSIVRVSLAICLIASATMAMGQTAAPATAPAPPPSAPAKRSPAELEKLAMPIALHPDPLIAVLLPASVYPVEIVQAARFVRDTNNIPKIDEQPWDDNVKAVAKFPQLVAQMDKDLSWTVELGQAFLDQPKELMDTIQALRAKAQTAGTLQTTPQQIVTVTNTVVEKVVEQQTVVVTNTIVQIQPASTEVVYVPSYPPTVYYPPPGYVYSPYAPLVTFGAGMLWGAAIAGAWNNCNWGHGDVEINNVNVNRNNNNNINANRNNNIGNNRGDQRSGARSSTMGAGGGGQKWQPDQNRLRSSGAPTAATREARGWTPSNTASSRGSGSLGSNAGARPSTTGAGARPSTGASSYNRPSSSGGSSFDRPSSAGAGAGAQNRGTSAGAGRSASGGSAFSGVNSGASARSYSNRGSSSLGGGGRSGGGFGGGGGRGGGGRGGGGRR